MIGPFGGWIAAALLRPVVDHPERLGEPISITIDFVAAIRAGRYDVRVELLRRNRSTSFWFARLVQDQDGDEVHCASATVVLAVRRATKAFAIAAAPEAAAPETLRPLDARSMRAKWMEQYDMRFVSGVPFTSNASVDASDHTIAWVRDRVATRIDFCTLVAMSDCAFPQIFHRITSPIPISTVSMTVRFHATSRDLAALENDFILYDATMRVAYEGFFDETSSIYSRAGTMIATMEQIVWYKIVE
jgi:acyl-CoA thioesterase